VISRRPPDIAEMLAATRSADRPGPGNRFGHEVTIRQRRVSARAKAGAASAPASDKAPPRAKFRRVILLMMSPVKLY
jgi:hypothetical protein